MCLQSILIALGSCCAGVLVAVGLTLAMEAAGFSHGDTLRRECVRLGGSVMEGTGGFYCQRTMTPNTVYRQP